MFLFYRHMLTGGDGPSSLANIASKEGPSRKARFGLRIVFASSIFCAQRIAIDPLVVLTLSQMGQNTACYIETFIECLYRITEKGHDLDTIWSRFGKDFY